MKKQVLHRFTAEMDALQTDGLIDHFISDVYNREIRRYSPQLMESVENIFQASSELIASELTQTAMNDHDEKTMMEAVLSMYITLDAFDFTMPEQISLTKSVFDNFFREFKGSWELKGEMEKLYKRLNGELDRYLANDLVYPKYEPLKTTIIALTAQYRSNPVQISLHKLCADIIHMHLNRIFIHQQRYFEMVSYYLLNRVLNSKKFRLIS